MIQPQVPLRLPCYDFIPVINHTFGACLLAVGSATSGAVDFRDVTGGVYKARERIQGVVADTPLLAIPASWSRLQTPIRTEDGFYDLLHLAVLLRSVPPIVARVQPWT